MQTYGWIYLGNLRYITQGIVRRFYPTPKKEKKLINPLINKLLLVQKTNESCGIVT